MNLIKGRTKHLFSRWRSFSSCHVRTGVAMTSPPLRPSGENSHLGLKIKWLNTSPSNRIVKGYSQDRTESRASLGLKFSFRLRVPHERKDRCIVFENGNQGRTLGNSMKWNGSIHISTTLKEDKRQREGEGHHRGMIALMGKEQQR